MRRLPLLAGLLLPMHLPAPVLAGTCPALARGVVDEDTYRLGELPNTSTTGTTGEPVGREGTLLFAAVGLAIGRLALRRRAGQSSPPPSLPLP